MQERAAILQLHAGSLPLADDVALPDLATACHGYSGADLAALCREAAMTALSDAAAAILEGIAFFPNSAFGCIVVGTWELLSVHEAGNKDFADEACDGVSAAQDSTAQHRTGQHSTGQDSTAQHSTAQHSTAQHSTAQHSTAQRSAAQHSTAQHSTA